MLINQHYTEKITQLMDNFLQMKYIIRTDNIIYYVCNIAYLTLYYRIHQAHVGLRSIKNINKHIKLA